MVKENSLSVPAKPSPPFPVCDRFYSPVIFGLAALAVPFFLFFRFQHQFLIALAENGGEGGVAIHRLQFLYCFGNEVLYFELSVYDERERRRLHTSDGKYLLISARTSWCTGGWRSCPAASRRWHAKAPPRTTAGNRTHPSGQTLRMASSVSEEIPDASPDNAHRLSASPNAESVSLLSGITAVYNHVGMLHEVLDYGNWRS